jgi:hypothetical protein
MGVEWPFWPVLVTVAAQHTAAHSLFHVCGRNTQHYRYDAPSAALPTAEDVLDPSDLRVATSLPINPSSPIEFPPALRATTTTPPADNRRCLPTTTFAVYP